MSHLLFSFFLLIFAGLTCAQDCPCADKKLCEPIKTGPRKELFVFSSAQADHYSWDKLTTISVFAQVKGYDPQVLCKAHSKGVRVILPAFFSANDLNNTQKKQQWIADQVSMCKANFFDGVNLDFEDEIDAGSPNVHLLTELMQDLYKAFKTEMPHSQVTFDAAWSPAGIDKRFYDYVALAKATDFLVIMAYDEQSMIHGPCKAGATSDYTFLIKGVHAFLAQGIPRSKLVIALPWYGHDFICDNPTNATVCPLKLSPWRGWPCTDAGADEINYSGILNKYILKSKAGRQWDSVSRSPWFNYVDDSGQTHQMWYDDPESLRIKVEYSKQAGLRGVGVFMTEFVDYNVPSEVDGMWGAMNSFFD